MKICLNCGQKLTASQKKYCSRSCAATNNNTHRGSHKRVYCVVCGTPTQNNRNIYCSKKCEVLGKQKILVDNWLSTGKAEYVSSKANHYIRKYIMQEQNNCCAVCGLFPIWCDQSLVFILDHIDGNFENNCRDNLRLVCPNCDSQLSTYKAKNKGNGRSYRSMKYHKNKSI